MYSINPSLHCLSLRGLRAAPIRMLNAPTHLNTSPVHTTLPLAPYQHFYFVLIQYHEGSPCHLKAIWEDVLKRKQRKEKKKICNMSMYNFWNFCHAVLFLCRTNGNLNNRSKWNFCDISCSTVMFFFVFFLDMTTVVTFGNTGETRLLTNNWCVCIWRLILKANYLAQQ